jgi:hypothetical protein
MTRPGHVPITRLRFRGRGPTLRSMCEVFRKNPGSGMSAAEVAERGDLDFRDVHQRLADTPELFVPLPRQADGNARYQLASAMAGKSPSEVAGYIEGQTRIESRIAAIVVATFVLVFVVAITLSLAR